MSTMNKCNIGGHDFYYERVSYLSNNKGVAVFAIKDNANAKEFDLYWVVIPTKLDFDKVIESPKDGRVVCMCRKVVDAKLIASSINIAHELSTRIGDLDKIIKDKFKTLDGMYDTDAMSNEIRRLHSEGKNDAEILEIMRSKRESFLRKNPTETKNGGEW